MEVRLGACCDASSTRRTYRVSEKFELYRLYPEWKEIWTGGGRKPKSLTMVIGLWRDLTVRIKNEK